MKVVFHKRFFKKYTADPAAARGRLEPIVEALSPHATWVEAEPAARENLLAVHTEAHLDWVKQQGVHEIAALAAGGAIGAATFGMEAPCFGVIRPPGHHASPDSAWGFCYYCNMAVALVHLLGKGAIRTAHVLDFDMHFGDGNVACLQRWPEITLHNPSHSDRGAYLAEVTERLERCEADIIGISAGFDDHVLDWGGTLETSDYRVMGRQVREAAARNGGGCFAILEGGYNHEVIGDNALALVQGLSGMTGPL
jgi:acetoin utilization deacetylase AcuC-like enzyme